MKRTARPPLGAMPRFIYEEHRIVELKEAIVRYLEANWPVPTEIISEYNELTNRLDSERDGNWYDVLLEKLRIKQPQENG